jgi:hypothetical protein
MPWDVFVSHASEDKESIAKPLADALKKAGLSVWYDEFELKVGDSLRRSIDDGLSKSQYGIVILSPAFFAKEWTEKELDGLVQQEAAGKNRILPVWFGVSADDVRAYSPMLSDRIAAKWSDGLSKVMSDIVSLVTEEPSLAPQEHQEVVAEAASAETGSLVLLMTNEGYLLVSSRLVEGGAESHLELLPENPRESAYLQGLSTSQRDDIAVAFGSTALLAHITEAKQVFESGQEVWKLTLQEVETDYGAGAMEVSVDGHPADEIAEMRARRILLNETGGRLEHKGGDLNENMLEMFIQGMSAPLKVPRSPLPGIYSEWKDDPETFLPIARLTAILWLRLSGAIERVLLLDMQLVDEGLRVVFEGQRRRKFSNVDAYVIRIHGISPLRRNCP